MRDVDLAIIGAGAAGLTAAAVAARSGLDVVVIERMGVGGQVMTVGRIDNLPDHPEGIAGFDFGPSLQEAAEDAGASFALDTVVRLEPASTLDAAARHVLHCEGETVAARAVLVAAGSTRRKLGVPGEAAFEGRGVSHCACCDGPLFSGEPVCVVGGGDSAVGEAIALAAHASAVTLVFEGSAPHAQPYLLEALARLPNVSLRPNARVTAIDGQDSVTGVQLHTDTGNQRLPSTGVFIYAGLVPAHGFLGEALALDPEGRVMADAGWRSSVPGIHVAGDIRSGVPYTLVAAIEDGAAAAHAIVQFLNNNPGDKT